MCEALLILQASCSPITIYRGPFKPITRRQSYGAPAATVATSYDAPIVPQSSYSSPSSSSSDSYGSPPSPSLATPSVVPAIPSYNSAAEDDCVVERSTTNSGGDCQQGGQVIKLFPDKIIVFPVSCCRSVVTSAPWCLSRTAPRCPVLRCV